MAEDKPTFLYSPRGHPLIWTGGHPKVGDAAILTMELYCKWYELFLVWPDKIESLGFDVLDKREYYLDDAYFCDHVPNPNAVRRYADINGHHLDEQAHEMIIGRWELEYLETSSAYYGNDDEEISDMLESATFVQEGEDPLMCPQCDGPSYELGKLGKNTHYRCRSCGSDHYKEPDQ